jgi:GrpB-like predicted nucleotidyltransferase (UPF0157 family)
MNGVVENLEHRLLAPFNELAERICSRFPNVWFTKLWSRLYKMASLVIGTKGTHNKPVGGARVACSISCVLDSSLSLIAAPGQLQPFGTTKEVPMARRIEVVDQTPEWSVFFEKEAAQLAVIFGKQLVAIHHIGSTAIPGIKAKPIIDILVVIKHIKTIETFNASMRQLGYRPRGECLDNPVPGTPGRFYFSKDTGGVRTHQVHVCQEGHADVEDKLAFRDYLRAHRKEAEVYSRMKERLAAEHRHDIVGYIQGKDAFVRDIIARGQVWRHNHPTGV